MIHFVKALQAFAHLEVVDCSFTALEAFALKKEGDLDELIAAHEGYVDRLASKILMRGTAGGRTVSRLHELRMCECTRLTVCKQDDSILKNTNKALETMLGFKDSLDALCNYALAEASRLDSERVIGGRDSRASTGTKGGLTGGRSSALSRPTTPISPHIPVEPAAAADPAVLQAITAQLHKRATGFEDLVTTLVHSLASHQDLDLRFLSVRLNFSLFYLQGGSGGSSSSKGK
jgi:gamma-tubulin complex component 3